MKFVRDLYPPVAFGLRLAIEAFQPLSGRFDGCFPSGVPVGQVLTLLIKPAAVVDHMKKVSRHNFKSKRIVCCSLPRTR
ncbi:hypothetical protein BJS_03521 [Bradyrhizobium japonicum SEMIA 5079]|nr:hypothetical protein BJS_03521 [Bradyrhizobium japonicum SEMIA 5079]